MSAATRSTLYLATLAIFVAALLTYLTPQFQTNDDVAMALTAAGKTVVDFPSATLVFQHRAIGMLLVSLYESAPDLPWYGFLHYGLLITALAALTRIFLRSESKSRAIYFLWCAWLVVFAGPTFVSPQFTILATLLAGAGMAGILRVTDPEEKNSIVRNCAYAALILVGSLIRLHAVFLALLIFVPFLLVRFRDRNERLTLILLAALTVAAFGGEQINRRWVESSPGWRGFYEFNNLRSEFTDRRIYSPELDGGDALEEIGWSETDFYMLRNWFFADGRIFTTAKMHRLADQAHALTHMALLARFAPLPNVAAEIFSSVAGVTTLILFVCTAVLVPTRRWFVLGNLLWCTVIFSGLVAFESLPKRVWLPALLLENFFALTVLATSTLGGELSRRWLRQGALAALFVGVGAMIFAQSARMIATSAENEKIEGELRDDLARLNPQADQLFVVWGGSFPFEAFLPPLAEIPEEASDFKVLGLGVTTLWPPYRTRLSQFKIDDLPRAFATREDIFLIAKPEWHYVDLLEDFLDEHYQLRTGGFPYFEGKTFTVYRFEKL